MLHDARLIFSRAEASRGAGAGARTTPETRRSMDDLMVREVILTPAGSIFRSYPKPDVPELASSSTMNDAGQAATGLAANCNREFTVVHFRS